MFADRHAENGLRGSLRLLRSGGELDTAGLAALAGGHLRLDHAWPDALRRFRGLARRRGERALRHRNARGPEQRLAGMLGEVHLPYFAQ